MQHTGFINFKGIPQETATRTHYELTNIYRVQDGSKAQRNTENLELGSLFKKGIFLRLLIKEQCKRNEQAKD